MTVYRFTPPVHKSRAGNPITGLLKFLQDPIGDVVNLALDTRSAKDSKAHDQENMVAFSVDDEYDTLNFDLPQISSNPRRAPYDRALIAGANEALPILTQIYQTGVYLPGLPKSYRDAAKDVAKIGAAKLARGATPEQPPEQITLPRTDTRQDFMGGFIPPGGMAGFSQMTPASQLSLTRGARGTRRSPKRRKTRTKRARKAKVKRTKRAGKAKRFVKGSKAAKAYMAKIRRKRRK